MCQAPLSPTTQANYATVATMVLAELGGRSISRALKRLSRAGPPDQRQGRRQPRHPPRRRQQAQGHQGGRDRRARPHAGPGHAAAVRASRGSAPR
jgi:hypothetical protein